MGITLANFKGFRNYPNPPLVCRSLAHSICTILNEEEETWECFLKLCQNKSIIEK